MKAKLAAIAVFLSPLVFAATPASAHERCDRGERSRYSGYYGYSSSNYPTTYRYTSYSRGYRYASYPRGYRYASYYSPSYRWSNAPYYGRRYYGYGPSIGVTFGYGSANRYRYGYRLDLYRGYRAHDGFTGSRRYRADFGYNRGR